MPPQQPGRLLDLFDEFLDLGPHDGPVPLYVGLDLAVLAGPRNRRASGRQAAGRGRKTTGHRHKDR
jgi:hypothetical protein